jgi:hypothetical protein
MTRQERRAQERRARRANIAVASMVGATALAFGGLAVSGAFPGESPKNVPPAEASQTGLDHAHAGISQAEAHAPAEQAGTEDAGSRLDGLETAAGNVTNPVASAVIDTLMENTPGPGFGEQAADAATSAASQLAPATPSEASDGLEHKP